MKKRPYRAALAGYYGFGNLGDELLLEASLRAFGHCGVARHQIVVFSNEPAETKRRFGVFAVDRWCLKQVFATLKQSDTLLLGGGGLFQDTSSRRSCLYYWGLVRMASFAGTVAWAVGQSVGPLSTRTGRTLARNALKHLRLLQVRDKPSEGLCRGWGIPFESGHDLVLSLTESDASLKSNPDSMNKILVNLRPWGDSLPERFADALAEMRKANDDGLELVGVAFADEDERLMRRLHAEGRVVFSGIERLTNREGAERLWSQARFALGMRFHFAVLSASYHVPLVSVPYDPKVEAFAGAWGVPLWQQGPLPKPVLPLPPSDFVPQDIFVEFEKLYRSVEKSL